MRILLALLAAGCSGPAVTALHDLHQPSTQVVLPTATDDFYTLPFPNDLHARADGTLDLTRYPVQEPGSLLAKYVDAFGTLSGAGTNSGIYFRFDGAIDASTLPADANASVEGGATAFVVDVTEGSPTYGMKRPVRARFVEAAYDFIGPNWLALLPFPGVPLREKTTYAALLTDGIKAAGGGAVQRARDLDAVLRGAGDARVTAAIEAYAPLTRWLATQPGLSAHLVNATVFTTGDLTSIMFKLRQAVYAQAPPPSLADLKYSAADSPGVDGAYDVYQGTYLGPNFQTGTAPYLSGGGAIAFDAAGTPKLDHLETLRVAMSIPKGAAMPNEGWPVVLYAHGTGGDYKSFLGDGSGREAASIKDGSGNLITRMAMISIDQVVHGSRVPSGTSYDLAFFNLTNLPAFRDNVKQGALDDFQLLRLVKAINVGAAPSTGAPIKFDSAHLYFKGHSQGGLTGPLFVAAEPDVKAAVFSGAGGVIIYALLDKTQPVDIAQLVSALFHDPVDEFHPVLNLAQSYAESSDPENYAKDYFREPPAGFLPKSIYQSLGVVDHYTPLPVIKALALAIGVQPVTPALEPIAGLDLAGLAWTDAPVASNVAGGQASGVLVEYNAAPRSDGHFVVFDVPAAIQQSNRFLGTHVKSGVATLTLP